METVDRELQEEVLVEMSDCGANAMRIDAPVHSYEE